MGTIDPSVVSENYQVSNANGTAPIGSRYCYALSVQEVLDYLGTTSSMTYENTTLRAPAVWEMFFPEDTNYPVYKYIWLRSASAYSSGIAFYVIGYNGSLGNFGYGASYLVRPAFVIDLSNLSWTEVQE